MVRSLKAALVLSLVVVASQALAAGSVPATALVSYLESTEGYARFESLITSPEKLGQIQNFIRGRGARDAEITDALKATGAERATRLRGLLEDALKRGASDPALSARVNKVAQEMLGVSDSDLNRVASLQLSPGNGQGGRAGLTRGGSAIDFGKMPGNKFGPAMPDGVIASPVRANAIPALLTQLAALERDSGGISTALQRVVSADPELIGEGFFDACLGRGEDALDPNARKVLYAMIEAADTVPLNVANRDVAVTEAAIRVGMEKTFRDREEEIDAVDTLANQCGYPGPRYVRGIAAIRAGL